MQRLYKNYYIMEQQEYEGIKYTICFTKGGWFTCYLDVTTTPLLSKSYESIDLSVWRGLTWSDCRYPFQTEDTERWIIGWDYGHCDDALEHELEATIFGYCSSYEGIGYVHHTLPELILDCEQAIDQILNKGAELCSNDFSQ